MPHFNTSLFNILLHCLEISFLPFFLTLSDSVLREMLQQLLASPKLFTVLPWPISMTRQFLLASSVNDMSLEAFSFSHFASNIISFPMFIQLHLKLLSVHFYVFWPVRAIIISWKADRPANRTLAKWSCLVILLLWFFLFSVCIPLPSHCLSWSCQAFKCKLFGEGLYVSICFFIAVGGL